MADIQHVVVLMLENRSFDSMLGRLYPGDSDYRGLSLEEMNVCSGAAIRVWNDTGMDATTACIPTPDPGELFTDMNMQLFGDAGRGVGLASMGGFAQNCAQQPSTADGTAKAADVMHYFTPEQVPVISTLARAFGVCDCWHASAPCQTWPNRFFAHTGTALGHVDNHTFGIPFDAPSVFKLLGGKQKSWRVYYHDMPQSLLLRDVWLEALLHYRLFDEFLADARSGALPGYSFIEPRYFTDVLQSLIPNDEHPPHNVVYGEQLIAEVYNALRGSPCWDKTLFIITFDEHGGCYDHVPPPAAVAPDGIVANPYGFEFDAYGVRVPAVIVSPYIPAGSKVRPVACAGAAPYPFDHTSIIRTLCEVFALGDGLTARDKAAPSLMSALTLAAPDNGGPLSIQASAVQPTAPQVQARAEAVPNGMQASLAAAATLLPDRPPAVSGAALPQSATPDVVSYLTVSAAQAHATARTEQFLGR